MRFFSKGGRGEGSARAERAGQLDAASPVPALSLVLPRLFGQLELRLQHHLWRCKYHPYVQNRCALLGGMRPEPCRREFTEIHVSKNNRDSCGRHNFT